MFIYAFRQGQDSLIMAGVKVGGFILKASGWKKKKRETSGLEKDNEKWVKSTWRTAEKFSLIFKKCN